MILRTNKKNGKEKERNVFMGAKMPDALWHSSTSWACTVHHQRWTWPWSPRYSCRWRDRWSGNCRSTSGSVCVRCRSCSVTSARCPRAATWSCRTRWTRSVTLASSRTPWSSLACCSMVPTVKTNQQLVFMVFIDIFGFNNWTDLHTIYKNIVYFLLLFGFLAVRLIAAAIVAIGATATCAHRNRICGKVLEFTQHILLWSSCRLHHGVHVDPIAILFDVLGGFDARLLLGRCIRCWLLFRKYQLLAVRFWRQTANNRKQLNFLCIDQLKENRTFAHCDDIALTVADRDHRVNGGDYAARLNRYSCDVCKRNPKQKL